jgi:lipid A 3-O-deacylase
MQKEHTTQAYRSWAKNIMAIRALLSAAFCGSMFFCTSLTATSAAPSSGAVGIYLENDLFGGTDRYYTSGAKISWSSRDLANLADSPYSSPFLGLFDLLPYINEKAYQKNLLFSIGQNIYTPEDTDTPSLITDDRPYAGYLYIGLGVAWKTAEIRNTLALNVGVVGPWSLARQTQRLVHDARGNDHPRGWANQLHNELGLTAVYLRNWRWPKQATRSGLGWELLPHAGAAAGNVQTYANMGGELRIGLNLPDDFGTSAISPAESSSTPVDGSLASSRSRLDFGVYLFSRVDGRLVAHNIFLDGNTFAESHSVDRKLWVADLSAGLGVNYKNTKVAYNLVYRTEEFKGQKGPQVFGTVSVNFSF